MTEVDFYLFVCLLLAFLLTESKSNRVQHDKSCKSYRAQVHKFHLREMLPAIYVSNFVEVLSL